ncbi:MAG TPA: hypothetical protein DEG71_04245, partial [Clostridiales bacterium]|nr:hypothetical protein [Clostridiales bacterium]
MELKRYESYIFEKLEKVDSMYRNAKRQAEALSKKDTQKFLLLVQKREVIIKDIENIDNVLNSNELPKSLKCESVLKEINEKYKKIYQTNYIAHINQFPLRLKSNIYPIVYNQTHGCTLLIPKACFDVVGLFDEKQLVAQDFEFFYRAFLKFPHKLISEVLVTARDSSNRQGRRSKERGNIEYSELYISIIDNLTDEDIKLLSPDKLNFFYDMREFFQVAGYSVALE